MAMDFALFLRLTVKIGHFSMAWNFLSSLGLTWHASRNREGIADSRQGRRVGVPNPAGAVQPEGKTPVVTPYAAAVGEQCWGVAGRLLTGFDARHSHPWIAQVVEQPSHQRSVAGSTPVPTILSSKNRLCSTPPVAVGASRRRRSGPAIRPALAAGCLARGVGFVCGLSGAKQLAASPPATARPGRQKARQPGADRQLLQLQW